MSAMLLSVFVAGSVSAVAGGSYLGCAIVNKFRN